MDNSDSSPHLEDKNNLKENKESEESEEHQNIKSAKTGQWDGSEAELVFDEEAEEYEEKALGIKIKYKLEQEEIKQALKNKKEYIKNKKAQKSHVAIQVTITLILLALTAIKDSNFYLYLTIFPVIAIACILIFPYFSLKNNIKKLSGNQEFSVEIFPDDIEVEFNKQKYTINLSNDSCECEDLENIILVHPKKGRTLLIPIRAIEPEYLADVQAMIFSGAKPRYKD